MLLWEEQEWIPALTKTGKWAFATEHAAALSAWQREHLRVSWAHVEPPWDAESIAIAELHPPLNVSKNPGNPFASALDDAHKHFEAVAALRA